MRGEGGNVVDNTEQQKYSDVNNYKRQDKADIQLKDRNVLLGCIEPYLVI